MKPWLKNRNDRSACVNIFSELRLTDKFRHYLWINATSCYWSYIDFDTLTFLYYLHLYLYSIYISLYNLFLQFTTVQRFSFSQITLLYYAIKTIELITSEAVSFEKVFRWKNFLAFENQKFLLMKCFMKA